MSTAMVPQLTTERLNSLLSYNKETGVIEWKETGKGRPLNRISGSIDRHGYLQTRIDGKIYFNHRLAWMFVHGCMPVNVIDHIDGDTKNNRIENLRDVDRRTNQENQRFAPSSNKTTGLLGATLHKQTGKFMAKIQSNKKQIYIGLFETAELAHHAYLKAKRVVHAGGTI